MSTAFCWHELLTNDLARTKEFYGKLFSWSMQPMEMGGTTYTMINEGEEAIGGIMENPRPNAPPAWLLYIHVDDLTAAVARAEKLGGMVLQSDSPAGEFGRFAVLRDPAGAVFAVFQPAERT